ncbi:aminoglycoside phosphotransferase family protein [Falsibacillus albus]|uniref:Aminoglycoside phosphotransferase family protein n=1 Tax=Falsibacillus albus TaxID=2478915 RepID=A0A3L7JWI4_9BACI|nr:aminoglycoside phosphotransferase family protein [Falsibacillus albus]RLQ94614.1 aminoglycoside phosphotransferase family protein [Falsibacillus albus]
MNDQLKGKIEKEIGEINKIELLAEQGWTSQVSKIVSVEGTYLLKSAFQEKYRTWLKEEAGILEKLSYEKEVPVPSYHGFIEEKDASHLFMSFENGRSLTAALRDAASTTEKRALVKSFGRFLQHYHEMEPIKLLEKEGEWLERQLILAQRYVESGQADGTMELLNQLKTQKPSSVKQTMIHGDCTTDNVFVIDREVQLFIDIAGMTVGDPRYDISLAIRKFTPELIQAFYEGYTRYQVTKEEYQFFDEGLYEFF